MDKLNEIRELEIYFSNDKIKAMFGFQKNWGKENKKEKWKEIKSEEKKN